jgi:hypothetical protein
MHDDVWENCVAVLVVWRNPLVQATTEYLGELPIPVVLAIYVPAWEFSLKVLGELVRH